MNKLISIIKKATLQTIDNLKDTFFKKEADILNIEELYEQIYDDPDKKKKRKETEIQEQEQQDIWDLKIEEPEEEEFSYSKVISKDDIYSGRIQEARENFIEYIANVLSLTIIRPFVFYVYGLIKSIIYTEEKDIKVLYKDLLSDEELTKEDIPESELNKPVYLTKGAPSESVVDFGRILGYTFIEIFDYAFRRILRSIDFSSFVFEKLNIDSWFNYLKEFFDYNISNILTRFDLKNYPKIREFISVLVSTFYDSVDNFLTKLKKSLSEEISDMLSDAVINEIYNCLILNDNVLKYYEITSKIKVIRTKEFRSIFSEEIKKDLENLLKNDLQNTIYSCLINGTSIYDAILKILQNNKQNILNIVKSKVAKSVISIINENEFIDTLINCVMSLFTFKDIVTRTEKFLDSHEFVMLFENINSKIEEIRENFRNDILKLCIKIVSYITSEYEKEEQYVKEIKDITPLYYELKVSDPKKTTELTKVTLFKNNFDRIYKDYVEKARNLMILGYQDYEFIINIIRERILNEFGKISPLIEKIFNDKDKIFKLASKKLEERLEEIYNYIMHILKGDILAIESYLYKLSEELKNLPAIITNTLPVKSIEILNKVKSGSLIKIDSNVYVVLSKDKDNLLLADYDLLEADGCSDIIKCASYVDYELIGYLDYDIKQCPVDGSIVKVSFMCANCPYNISIDECTYCDYKFLEKHSNKKARIEETSDKKVEEILNNVSFKSLRKKISTTTDEICVYDIVMHKTGRLGVVTETDINGSIKVLWNDTGKETIVWRQELKKVDESSLL